LAEERRGGETAGILLSECCGWCGDPVRLLLLLLLLLLLQVCLCPA
jgi:hypothetical protein